MTLDAEEKEFLDSVDRGEWKSAKGGKRQHFVPPGCSRRLDHGSIESITVREHASLQENAHRQREEQQRGSRTRPYRHDSTVISNLNRQ
jgi:hypothetical protein